MATSTVSPRSDIARGAGLVAGAALALLVTTGPARAQLASGPVVYGHHHLTVTSVDAHVKFWIDALGGTKGALGTGTAAVFPRVLVLLRQGAPTGGTKGTSVNHIGFGVPDLKAAIARVKAAGFAFVTRAEAPPALTVADDMAYVPDQKTSIAYVMGPDDVKVELVEMKGQATPIALHHIHYYGAKPEEMRAWYTKTFGAAPGMRGSFLAADLPGVNLTFSPTADAVAPTKGRVLDHVGYEVKDLEAFCARLTAAGVTFDRPYSKNAGLGIGLAFFTDPFGTYVELTEGLDAAVKR